MLFVLFLFFLFYSLDHVPHNRSFFRTPSIETSLALQSLGIVSACRVNLRTFGLRLIEDRFSVLEVGRNGVRKHSLCVSKRSLRRASWTGCSSGFRGTCGEGEESNGWSKIGI